MLSKIFRQKIHPFIAAGLGVLLIFSTAQLKNWARREARQRRNELKNLDRVREQSSVALNNALSFRDLKETDVARFKAGLSGLVQSRSALYQAGLSMQEEKRLLEKQLEIMTTYLMIDPETKRISLMRGDQVLKSYPVIDVPPRAFGGDVRPLPSILKIASKERFAHPERGQTQMVNGKLQWNPPQVGTSLRANALGEYVMFTREGLILHGPPKNEKEHQACPHHCLELSLSAARDLYRYSFIGTKILLPAMNEAAAPPAKPK
jgi:hypothetical protein